MRSTRWLVAMVAIILGALTLAGTAVVWVTFERNRIDRLDLASAALVELFEVELERLIDLGTAVAVALPPSDELSNDTWQALMDDLRLLERYPAVLGNSYNARVPRDELDQWVADRTAEGDGFALRRDTGGEELRVIRYAFPQPMTAPSVGVDVLGSPENREALERVTATGRPALTPAFQISSLPEGEPGAALYLPLSDPSHNGAAIAIALSGPVFLEALEPLPADVTVTLIDPTSSAFEVVGQLPGSTGPTPSEAGPARTTRTVGVGPDHPGWQLAITQNPGFESPLARFGPGLVLLLGGFITALAAALTHTLAAREEEARQRVAEATDALAGANLRLSATNVELAAVNAELRDADRHKDDFLASVSHELRTPLTAIMGFLESMRRLPAAALDTEAFLAPMERNALRLRTLVDDLLMLASLDAGALEVRSERLLLAEVIPELLDDLLGVGVGDLDIELPPALAVRADRRHLDRIVTNLVTNALRHGLPPVEVRAHPRDGVVVLTVADHGHGVVEGETGTLFERFSRGRTAERSTGTGLGLALVRELVEINGGRVRYVEDDDGHRFEVELHAAG